MQDDLTWGVKYLVAQGIADPKRVGIMGGSYGGYATLAGVAFTPDVYAAGVSIVGPSNLITLLDFDSAVLGVDPKDLLRADGRSEHAGRQAQLERQSPLNSADKIKAPLLVVQGANDPRVNKARERSDRDRAARSRISRRVLSSRPTRVTASPGPSTIWRCLHGGREISGEASGWPLSGEHDTGDQGADGRADSRSKDGRAGEESRSRVNRTEASRPRSSLEPRSTRAASRREGRRSRWISRARWRTRAARGS